MRTRVLLYRLHNIACNCLLIIIMTQWPRSKLGKDKAGIFALFSCTNFVQRTFCVKPSLVREHRYPGSLHGYWACSVNVSEILCEIRDSSLLG